MKLISSYCVIRKAAVLTLEDVQSLKLIVQGHRFTDCEQVSLSSSVCRLRFLSLIQGIVIHTYSLSVGRPEREDRTAKELLPATF